ncbi:MAG: hypothetical protein FH756_10790 [Firmicutes bacterium]|nr:hypothetical protein [Bacillota bacterium]
MYDRKPTSKAYGNSKGHYWRWVSRDDNHSSKSYLCNYGGGSNSGNTQNCDRRHVYGYDEPPKRHGQFRVLGHLSNQSGNSLVSLLVSFTLLVFLLMQPIDTFVFQSKHQMAENIMHKYLARMRLEGYLTTTDENNLIADFNNIKCLIQNPATDIIANARESNGDNRILRSSDPVSSELTLKITCKPDPQPCNFMQIFGGAPGSTTITVGGKSLSERVNP